MNGLISIILSGMMIFGLSGCAGSPKTQENAAEETAKTENAAEEKTEEKTVTGAPSDEELYADPIAFTIELENGGVMKGEVYPHLAPETVKNFTKLVKDKFYDGLIFHRVIDGFMIQGGGYDKDMEPRETDPIKGEFEANGFKNPLKHTRGVISMARTPDPDSASSQFFIMHQDSPHLDGQYAAFGKITEGIEVVDKIASVKTDYQDCPIEPQVIESIRLL